MIISHPKVMQSAAGYYVGRSYQDSDGYPGPYDRLSGYYRTPEDAAKELKYWEQEPDANTPA